MFLTFDVVMGDNRRNSSSGIIILFLMFVFFSFIHEEKERQISRTATQSPGISNPDRSGQAIICPAFSDAAINLFRTGPLNVKYSWSDCTSGRELIINNLYSSSFSSCQHKSHFRNPNLSLFLLQKVPDQGKEEDSLSII